MNIKAIKAEIEKRHKYDYPDTKVNVKWGRVHKTTFPSGVKGWYAFAEVSGKGYRTKRYTLTITNSGWSFK